MPLLSPRYGSGPADPPDPRHPCPDCGEERAETPRGYVCTDCTPPLCPDCRTPTHWRALTFRLNLVTPADCGDCPEPA